MRITTLFTLLVVTTFSIMGCAADDVAPEPEPEESAESEAALYSTRCTLTSKGTRCSGGYKESYYSCRTVGRNPELYWNEWRRSGGVCL